MSVRTLHAWQSAFPGAAKRRPGRPRLPGSSRWSALLSVRRVIRALGWSVGEGVVHQELQGRVSRYLVRESLGTLKAAHRRRREAHRRRNRVSVAVTCTDAVWAMDGTHLGRDGRTAVEGQTLKELASAGVLDVAVGPPAAGRDVVAQLERMRGAEGRLPLVVLSDNGPPYRSRVVREYMKRHRVIQLFTLPRTPQHNAACECAHGELKADAGLGKGVEVTNQDAAILIERSRRRINRRPRRSRRYRSADECHRAMTPWYHRVARDRFYNAACTAIENATQVALDRRAERRLVREAILRTLERFALIKRTRGGEALRACEAEVVS